jgi:hypothetical protein
MFENFLFVFYARPWLIWSTFAAFLQLTNILRNNSICQPTVYKLHIYHVHNRLILGILQSFTMAPVFVLTIFIAVLCSVQGRSTGVRVYLRILGKSCAWWIIVLNTFEPCVAYSSCCCHTESFIWKEWRGHGTWYVHPVFIKKLSCWHCIKLNLVLLIIHC